MIDGSRSQILNDSYTRLLEKKLVGSPDRIASPDLKAGPEAVNVAQAITPKGGVENSAVENADAVIAVAEQGAVSSVINVKVNSEVRA